MQHLNDRISFQNKVVKPEIGYKFFELDLMRFPGVLVINPPT